jgi:hypothetical protein
VTGPSALLGLVRDDGRAAVTIGDCALHRSELWSAASAVAERIAGTPVLAVHILTLIHSGTNAETRAAACLVRTRLAHHAFVT